MANNITSTVSASLTTTSQRSMIDFNVCHSNAQSLSAHLHDLQRVIQKNTIHVLGISETHLQPTMSSKLVSVPDFKLFRVGVVWRSMSITRYLPGKSFDRRIVTPTSAAGILSCGINPRAC